MSNVIYYLFSKINKISKSVFLCPFTHVLAQLYVYHHLCYAMSQKQNFNGTFQGSKKIIKEI